MSAYNRDDRAHSFASFDRVFNQKLCPGYGCMFVPRDAEPVFSEPSLAEEPDC